ncbi:RNA-binding domain-containing protein [Treponema primitia]|uniref:RNA-binding domain-containing protein n=1 Tax=Treponema primitia TaxID=88058 RepID=UPI0002554FFB|nr:RNA-binding domain-containing protein [Treponema primitia]
METAELIEIIARDEDSKHQFKANVTNEVSLAQEMIAFSNSGGGELYIGVNNDGTFAGLTREDLGRINQLVSNAASQNIRPPINPQTENIAVFSGLVMRIVVVDGLSKPYMDKNGTIWVKSGSDKRKATSREEIQRIFQAGSFVHADETPANGMTIADLDTEYFKSFFKKVFSDTAELEADSLPAILKNMNLMNGDILNLAGALLFSKNPSFKLPAFIVKAVCFPGNEIHESQYLDSRDIGGKLQDVFQQCMGFMGANIRHVQNGQGVNSLGVLEIPQIALEEILVNALIHRDYFISAPIRIFVFTNRIEIISPGHLPNNLTIENIKRGNSNIRNPVLASFATRILPYRGLGSGITRALKEYPHIDFEDDHDGNSFKVIIARKNGE